MATATMTQTSGLHLNGHTNGHSNGYSSGTSTAPAFPDDVPTAPLLRLSFAKLKDADPEEIQRLVRACEDLGFFYLDLRGPGDEILADADKLFTVGEHLYDLPLEEKKQYDFMHKNSYFGYKGYGANVVDKSGRTDRNEFYNVCQPYNLALDSANDRTGLKRRHHGTQRTTPSTRSPRFTTPTLQIIHDLRPRHNKHGSRPSKHSPRPSRPYTSQPPPHRS